MVRLGPYREVLRIPQSSFPQKRLLRCLKPADGASRLCRTAPETAFGRPARYFASAIPHATSLVEFYQSEGVSLKVVSALQLKCSMFSDPEHRYSPVILKWKTCATGKVNDEGSSSLRIQQFDHGEFQVGSFRAITLKVTCRSVRATIASMKLPSARRTA